MFFEGDGVFIAAGAKPFARILQGAGPSVLQFQSIEEPCKAFGIFLYKPSYLESLPISVQTGKA